MMLCGSVVNGRSGIAYCTMPVLYMHHMTVGSLSLTGRWPHCMFNTGISASCDHSYLFVCLGELDNWKPAG